MKIAVCTPWSSPFVWKKFAQNLAEMLCNFKRPQWDIACFFGRGIDPAARHIDMFSQGLDWGADLLLSIGADQVHPIDMIDRLINRWEETGGAIAALVPFRGYVSWQEGMRPFQPMGWRLECEGVREFRGSQIDGDMMKPINPADGDLQRADIIGSGVLLLHRCCFEALKKPWFFYRVHPETMQRIADMDTRFVYRLRIEAGIHLWVDTTIKVTHIHDMEIDETFQDRFSDWETQGVGDPNICKYVEPETSSTMRV